MRATLQVAFLAGAVTLVQATQLGSETRLATGVLASSRLRASSGQSKGPLNALFNYFTAGDEHQPAHTRLISSAVHEYPVTSDDRMLPEVSSRPSSSGSAVAGAMTGAEVKSVTNGAGSAANVSHVGSLNAMVLANKGRTETNSTHVANDSDAYDEKRTRANAIEVNATSEASADFGAGVMHLLSGLHSTVASMAAPVAANASAAALLKSSVTGASLTSHGHSYATEKHESQESRSVEVEDNSHSSARVAEDDLRSSPREGSAAKDNLHSSADKDEAAEGVQRRASPEGNSAKGELRSSTDKGGPAEDDLQTSTHAVEVTDGNSHHFDDEDTAAEDNSRISDHESKTDEDHSHASAHEDEAAQDARVAARMTANATARQKARPDQLPPTCSRDSSGDCKSMCRWLKLTDQDFNMNADLVGSPEHGQSTCPLLERSLEAFGFTFPELRLQKPQGSGEEQGEDPADCALSIVRLSVLRMDVPAYIDELDKCIDGVPKHVRDTYRVAFEVLISEIEEWRDEQHLRERAARAGEVLRAAISRGQNALSAQSGEGEALAELHQQVERADNITGHYLLNEVREGRRLIEELAPLPAVHKAADEALARGEAALSTGHNLPGAIAWLQVVQQQAQSQNLDSVVAPTQILLDQLNSVRNSLLQLHNAIIDGNISLRSKMNFVDAIAELNVSVQSARAHNLEGEVDTAEDILATLQYERAAREELKAAVRWCDHVLRVHGNETQAIHRLVAAKRLGDEVGLGPEYPDAAHCLERLHHGRSVREQVGSAVERARALLEGGLQNATQWPLEDTIAILLAAIHQAELSGHTEGLAEARELLARLQEISVAQSSLQAATASSGNITSADLDSSVAALRAAIAEARRLGLSDGVAEAERRLLSLLAVQASRDELQWALGNMSAAVHAGAGEAEAADRAHDALKQAAAAGLEVAVGEREVEKVEDFLDAQRELDSALRRRAASAARSTAPAASGAAAASAGTASGDEEVPPEAGTAETANASIPSIHGEDSPSDADFEHQIQALNTSIARARRWGVESGDLELRLERLIEMQGAWEQLGRASVHARAALNSLAGVDEAVIALTAALDTARFLDFPGLEEPQALLARLQEVEPARAELASALAQANVTLLTASGIQEALVRLKVAVDQGERLGLEDPHASYFYRRLTDLKGARVELQAAIVEGTLSLRSGTGEEMAISELTDAIGEAKRLHIRRDVPTATELLFQLQKLAAEETKVEQSWEDIGVEAEESFEDELPAKEDEDEDAWADEVFPEK